MVLESSAQYCPPERVVNNKGDFRLVTSLFLRKSLFTSVFNSNIIALKAPKLNGCSFVSDKFLAVHG